MAANTSVNTFDIVKKTAKIGTLHCERILVGGNYNGWKAYTPTLATGALNGADTMEWRYRIEGTTLFLSGTINHGTGAGTLGSGTYEISLPSGCTALSTSNIPVGAAYISGTNVKAIGCTILSSTTGVAVMYHNAATTTTTWGSTSHVELRLDSTVAFGVAVEAAIELDPTSTILARTYV